MKNNIDEDIKIYEIELNKIQAVNVLTNDLNKFEIKGEHLYIHKKAIENVLSELEELRKYDIRKIELKNGMIEKAPSFTKREIELMNLGIALNETTEKLELEKLNKSDASKEKSSMDYYNKYKETKSELETYKKIAEKLAEEVKEQAKYQKYCTTDNCTYEKTNCDITCIIDWARKEEK